MGKEVIMLKQNKGITMISLVVTVIVLMILASITTYSGISTAKESRYYNAVHQMKVMQSEVNSWYENQKDGVYSTYCCHVTVDRFGICNVNLQL